MTPQELVTKVYNVQEGVIIDDLYPIDDKYKEVLYQYNLVLDDFCKQADWSFLREDLVLGDTNPLEPGDVTIPKYILPDWVDRVSTLFEDAVKLYAHKHDGQIIEQQYISVPLVSRGIKLRRKFREYAAPLRAQVYGKCLTFNRQPIGHELDRVVVAEVQRKLKHLHICNEKCTTKDGQLAYVDDKGNFLDKPLQCKCIEDDILPYDFGIYDYLIWKTAYNTSKYSPIAGGIRGEIGDQANKLLSKIRNLDAAKTAPDVVRKSFNFNAYQVF